MHRVIRQRDLMTGPAAFDIAVEFVFNCLRLLLAVAALGLASFGLVAFVLFAFVTWADGPLLTAIPHR
jgi:hypothetical protein